LVVILVPLPAKIFGRTGKEQNTCGGITLETKPGTGYPNKWEDQSVYKGGWEKKNGKDISLKGAGKLKGLL